MLSNIGHQWKWVGVLAVINAMAFSQCTPEKTAFLAFGDWGMGNPGQYQVAKTMGSFCKENRCDFVTLLGDNIYPSGVSSTTDPQWKNKFEEPYKDLAINFYPTLGNHDYLGTIEAQWEYSSINPKWKFPRRFYSFKECFTDFFVIDAERFDEEQILWIQEAVAASNAKWKVVIGHRPIFSHGDHGDTDTLKEKLLPLLKNKVDLYLSGHDHDLEYLKKEYRPDFIVSGAAAETRPVGKGKSTLFSASVEGFTYIDLAPNRATIQFIDKEGKSIFKHSMERSK